MPDMFSHGAGLLLRTTRLSSEEWIQLVESRRLLLNPYLKCFSLKCLSESGYLHQEGGSHVLADDEPEVDAEEGLSLDTQGIFDRSKYTHIYGRQWSSVDSRERLPIGGSFCLWGLSRKAEWVVACVEYNIDRQHRGPFYERATKITIRRYATIGELVKAVDIEPRRVWELLGRTVSAWTEARLKLYAKAARLQAIVEAESAAVDKIGR